MFIGFAAGLVGALLPGGALHAGTFLIDGHRAGLSGTPVMDGWTMIGLVDDFVELADGDHVLRFEGPHRHGLSLKVKVRGNAIRPLETGSERPMCGELYDITWPQPRVEPDRTHPGVSRLELAPVRAAPTGESWCVSPAMAGCTQQKAILDVRSEPPGGEIWFRQDHTWKKQDFKTNITLSVPFCEGDETAPLLVRMDGRVNCLEELPLAPEARLTVACTLRVPGEVDPLETSAPPN
jgi:hypothetical protein